MTQPDHVTIVRALGFEEQVRPLLDALNQADNELLAAILAADGPRCIAASNKRTVVVNTIILDHVARCAVENASLLSAASFVETTHLHPKVAAEQRKPEGGRCPECAAELTQGFGLMGGSYGTYWICGHEPCSYFYKELSHE